MKTMKFLYRLLVIFLYCCFFPFVIVIALISPFIYLFTGNQYIIFDILDKYQELIEYFTKKEKNQ